MPFKAEYKKDFYLSKNKIYLNESYKTKNRDHFKKITGTRLAAILNKNIYTSPFKVWTMMTNLYFEKMDETLSKVGNAIEPKVRKLAEEKFGISFLSHNPFEIKWDAFQKNKIFGGIPDGEPVNEREDFLYKEGYPMLEIKTSSRNSFEYKMINKVLTLQKHDNNFPKVKEKNKKYESWFKDGKICVPEDYKLQLSLYLYLRKINLGVFAIAFLEDEDYAYPENFDVSNREIKFVLLNSDSNKFQEVIDYAEKWYAKYILTGISPTASEADLKWLNEELNL